MKLTKLFIFILVLFVSSNIWSAENNAFKDFQLAHQYYKNNQFKEAQTSYEQLLHRGYETSDLHYNLGNVYFRLNYIGLSILQYEKALKLNPNNEDAAFNLKIANLKVVSKIKPMSDFILVKWYKKLIQWKSVRQWAYGQILFAFIVLLSGILFIFSSSSRFKKIAFYLGIFSISLNFLCCILAWSAKKNIQSSDYGVITTPTYSLKSEPTDHAKDLILLHEGIKFMKVESIGKWYQIRLSDGNIGWVETSAIEMI